MELKADDDTAERGIALVQSFNSVFTINANTGTYTYRKQLKTTVKDRPNRL